MAPTPEELLRRSIEDLIREIRAERSSRTSAASAASRTTAPAIPATPATPAFSPRESGFSFDFDGEKVGEGFEKLLQGLAKSFENFKESMNTNFGGILDDVVKLRSELEKGRAELFKQSGAFKELQTTFSQVAPYAKSLGISYTEAASTLSTLTKEVSGFLDMSDQEREAMSKQTLALERLGVSASETAKANDVLIRSFGETPKQAGKSIESLNKFAYALKAPPNVIMKDFATAGPKLAMFGDKAKEVFMNSQIFVQKFGISLDSILGQIDKFDTFESAAEAAGKLNIALGDNFFDTQELLFTTGDPSKRIEMISKKLQEIKRKTGQSFDQMNVFLRKDLQSTLGLQADEIRRLEKLSQAELRSVQERVKAGKSIGQSIEESAKKTLTLDERLNAMKDRLLSAFLPLVEALTPIIQEVGKYITIFTNFIKNIFKQYPGFLKIATGIASAFAAYRALDGAGIIGIFEKLKNGIASFIPFGNQLSNFVLPGLGLAIAGFATKYGPEAVDKAFKDDKGQDSFLKKMLGLDDKQIKALQADLDKITTFIYDGFKSFLMDFLGLSEFDSISIIADFKQIFTDAFTEIEKGFGKIKKVFTSFFEGFMETMGEEKGKEGNPFIKILKGITGGLRKAVETLKKEFADDGSGTRGEMRSAIDEMRATFGQLKNEIIGVITSFTGGLFGSAGGGSGPGIIERLFNNEGFKTIAERFLGAIGSVFSGMGELIKAFTSGINFSQVTASMTEFLTAFINVFKESFGTFTGINNAEVKIIGDTAAGFGKLGESLGKLNKQALDDFKAGATGLGQAMNEVVAASDKKTISDTFIDSFKKLAESIKLLNEQLTILGDKKANLSLLTSTPQEQVTRLQSVAEAVERYSKAITTLRGYSAEQDKMNQVLNAIADMAGSIQIDSARMGEVIGDKVATALARRFS